MRVYIIEGRTGEYDSDRQWIVAGYADEALAKEHTEKANKFADEIYKSGAYRELIEFNNPYDPNMQLDSATGTEYYCYEIELRDKLPESK